MRFIQKLLGAGIENFEQDSRAWGLTLRQALAIAAIPIVVVLVMAATVPFFDLFVRLIDEDSVIEWLQFLLILAACLLFAWLSLRLFRSRFLTVGVLYLLVTLGTFFVAGEEIAWGQTLFGWGTPAALGAINYQHETTLHNISTLHGPFIYAVMLGALYGALVPLLAAAFWNKRPYAIPRHLLVPPLCLVPAFFMPFGYRFFRLVFRPERWYPHLAFPITEFSEVTELCLYFGLLLFAWLNLRRLPQ